MDWQLSPARAGEDLAAAVVQEIRKVIGAGWRHRQGSRFMSLVASRLNGPEESI